MYVGMYVCLYVSSMYVFDWEPLSSRGCENPEAAPLEASSPSNKDGHNNAAPVHTKSKDRNSTTSTSTAKHPKEFDS